MTLTLFAVIAALVLSITTIQTISETRLPFNRQWEWWAAVSLLGGAVFLAHQQQSPFVATIALGGVVGFLILPWALYEATWRRVERGLARSARFGAWLTFALHPAPSTVRALRIVLALARAECGKPENAEALVLATADPLARLSILAWRREMAGVAALLADETTRRQFVARGGGAVYVEAVADASGPLAVIPALAFVDDAGAAMMLLPDGGRALASAGAHLGAPEVVTLLADEIKAAGLVGEDALLLAIAHQRAGEPDRAREVIARTLAGMQAPVVQVAARLARHRDTPLAPCPSGPDRDGALPGLLERAQARSAIKELMPGHSIGPSDARTSPATYGIVAVVFGAWILQCGAMRGEGLAAIDRLGALHVPLEPAEAWRLVAYGFLHVGWLHVILNVLVLIPMGRFIEGYFGRARLLAVYAFTLVAAGLTVAMLSPAGMTVVGASGAVFGLMGAALGTLLLDATLRRSPEGHAKIREMAKGAAIQLAIGYLVPMISGAAHAGGFVAGLVLGAAFAATAGGRRRVRSGSA